MNTLTLVQILITNSHADQRPSVDRMCMALGRELQKAGHRVAAYTSSLSHIERFSEHDCIPISVRPEQAVIRPQIIHARHHMHAITALMALAGVPAIYDCDPGLENQPMPLHPRVKLYLTPSEQARQNLLAFAHNRLRPEHVIVAPPVVDLQTFSTVREAPATLRSAAFFEDRERGESPLLPVVRATCRKLGISLDETSKTRFHTYRHPQQVLPTLDLVFARGHSALQALACGCAVIMPVAGRCGPLVTPDNLDALSRQHFLVPPDQYDELPELSERRLAKQISAYNVGANAEVTRRIREDFGLEKWVRTLKAIYQQAIAEHQAEPPDPAAERAAVACYLNEIIAAFRATRWEDLKRPATMRTLEMLCETGAYLETLRRHMERMH